MSNIIEINGRKIGGANATYFIADVAANHDGDLQKAKDLVWACKEAGAHAAKFQNFEAKTIVSDFGFNSLKGRLSHQEKWEKSVIEVYEDASVPDEWTSIIKETCDEADIHYFTSPYSPDLVNKVAPYVAAWKLGSGDITWPDEIVAMCRQGQPLIMATGATTLDEVRTAYEIARKHKGDIGLLQCNTNYTANNRESLDERLTRFRCINLKVLETFSREFPDAVLGLSDHTLGHATVLGAVGLFGAKIVEKHFTLDNELVGPDHPFSMTPKTWREMVDITSELEAQILSTPVKDYDARYSIIESFLGRDERAELEASIGDGVKRVEENEKDTVVVQRRAICVSHAMSAGSLIKKEDLYPLRPCPEDAFPPYRESELIGKTLKHDLSEGQYVRLSDIV